jgi:hypothetical protein
MSISEEQIVELAQQYLSKLQRANEIEFAINKPGVGQDYYDFIDGLDSKCSHLADDFRIGYQNDEVEADLESALGVANIKVDRESKEYKLLISKFLFAATQACFQSLSMYKGDFDYKLEITKLGTKELVVVSSRKTRKSTIVLQNYVNIIAREEKIIHPDSVRKDLVIVVAEKLESKYGIKIKPVTILRDYLGKFPNF